MREEGVTTVTCEFCNQSYLFDEADLERLIAT
jgi:redox-regulated HSP33 family molecular chaperone